RRKVMSPQFDLSRAELLEQITNAWIEVLGSAEVSEDANFFDIGGTSLKALQVYARLRDILGSVSVTDLFRYPTIRSFLGRVACPDQVTQPPSKREPKPGTKAQAGVMSSDERAERQRQAFDQLRNRF